MQDLKHTWWDTWSPITHLAAFDLFQHFLVRLNDFCIWGTSRQMSHHIVKTRKWPMRSLSQRTVDSLHPWMDDMKSVVLEKIAVSNTSNPLLESMVEDQDNWCIKYNQWSKYPSWQSLHQMQAMWMWMWMWMESMWMDPRPRGEEGQTHIWTSLYWIGGGPSQCLRCRCGAI